MNVITDPATLATVKQMHDEVEAAGEVVRAARTAHSEAFQRRKDLLGVRAAHNAAEPMPEPDVSAELGEMLAKNPAAAASTDWEGMLREGQDKTAAAVLAWKGKGTVIDQAVNMLDVEVDERASEQAKAEQLHERAWVAFVNAARNAMTVEVELRFAGFYADVLGPLDALNGARKLYANEPVYSGVRRQVTHDSVLMIGTPNGFGGHHDAVKLYPSDDVAARSALLASFRERLSEPAPKARGRERGAA